MTIPTELIKELRERTGAGVLECKQALEKAEGDLEAAANLLRQKGLARAAKVAGRAAEEGVIDAYIHGDGRHGCLMELNCETDFVARTAQFRELARELAMQVVAMRPVYVGRDDVPAEVREREEDLAQQEAQGKPAEVIRRIVEGKLEKYYDEMCLLDQSYIRDPELKIKDLIAATVAKLGENIRVRRFTRYSIGE